MLDGSNLRPELSLFLHPEDDAEFVMTCDRLRVGGAAERGAVFVAVHRRHGTWTHVYCVVNGRRTDRMTVYLEKVFAGDRAQDAVAWARARMTPSTEIT
jgi:hypothetical protein